MARRWPAGSPVGGRFAPADRPPAESSLEDDDAWQEAAYAAYVEEQQQADYEVHVAKQMQSDYEAHVATVELAELLAAESESIEFLDHSAGAESGDWVTLAEMADGGRAGNNCWAATNAIAEHLVEQIGTGPNQEVLACELAYESGVHWAPVIRYDTGQEMVIDFTARQFDPSVAFPLVEPLDRWKARADSWVGSQFGDPASSMTLS